MLSHSCPASGYILASRALLVGLLLARYSAQQCAASSVCRVATCCCSHFPAIRITKVVRELHVNAHARFSNPRTARSLISVWRRRSFCTWVSATMKPSFTLATLSPRTLPGRGSASGSGLSAAAAQSRMRPRSCQLKHLVLGFLVRNLNTHTRACRRKFVITRSLCKVTGFSVSIHAATECPGRVCGGMKHFPRRI